VGSSGAILFLCRGVGRKLSEGLMGEGIEEKRGRNTRKQAFRPKGELRSSELIPTNGKEILLVYTIT
jgi:hypothetical protein